MKKHLLSIFFCCVVVAAFAGILLVGDFLTYYDKAQKCQGAIHTHLPSVEYKLAIPAMGGVKCSVLGGCVVVDLKGDLPCIFEATCCTETLEDALPVENLISFVDVFHNLSSYNFLSQSHTLCNQGVVANVSILDIQVRTFCEKYINLACYSLPSYIRLYSV